MSLNVDLVKPVSLETEELSLTKTFGRFIAEPLERGYGMTLGNALRRVILSSLSGSAFTAIRIEGVFHEFSTVPGVLEDVTDIILNSKEVIIRLERDEPARCTYRHSGSATDFKAGDLECPPGAEILNPEVHIATLNEEANLDIELVASVGRGYVPAERNAEELNLAPQFIPVDSVFSPIRRCSFTVEKTRVGDVTDYDKLVLEVETNGAV
jgi:DNA-directed RNA polymerase subunit alpha